MAEKKIKDWCDSSGEILRGGTIPLSAVCPGCAQTVNVEHGVILAHRDARQVGRKRLNLQLAQLEVAHAEKDLALAKAKLAKAMKAVTP